MKKIDRIVVEEFNWDFGPEHGAVEDDDFFDDVAMDDENCK